MRSRYSGLIGYITVVERRDGNSIAGERIAIRLTTKQINLLNDKACSLSLVLYACLTNGSSFTKPSSLKIATRQLIMPQHELSVSV